MKRDRKLASPVEPTSELLAKARELFEAASRNCLTW
jgi:hypothetical protein